MDLAHLRKELYAASTLLSHLRLVSSAKWVTEALNGLAPVEEPFDYSPAPVRAEDQADHFKVMLAKSYFDSKEFDRAANVLKECRSGNAVFLRLYATYISIDKQALEDSNSFMHEPSRATEPPDEARGRYSTPHDGTKAMLGALVLEVDDYHAADKGPNAFLLYLAGMVYNKKGRPLIAHDYLLQSLMIFPYNWSCWQELLLTFSSYNDAAEFVDSFKANVAHDLGRNVMFKCFEVVLLQEFYQNLAVFADKIAALTDVFPHFTFLKVQKFLVAYHMLDYYTAESLFDEILIDDPMRLDDLDTYSNMLYVMEKKSKLSFLAQYASQIDKFRSETCCVIANYHSMKGEHDKSIMYYKRALTLNKNCLSAWTLMGHEFVELKNSHAAIESYRRAVDINPKDFRAWYGLGQAYEVLDMHLYALYYYQRATNLQPTDKRMWQAIGNCYEKIDKLEEALQSFEKALAIDSFNKASDDDNHPATIEPHICYKLATISEKLARPKETYKYMRMCFDQEPEWGVTDETSKSRLWLARHALQNKHYEEVYELAKEFHFSNALDVEDARAVVKEARNRMSANNSAK